MKLNYKDWNLRSRIIFAALIPFVISAVLTLPILSNNVATSVETKAKAYVDELAYGLNLNIKMLIDRYTNDTRVIAESFSIISDQNIIYSEAIDQILLNIIAKNKDFAGVWLISNANNTEPAQGLSVFWYKDINGVPRLENQNINEDSVVFNLIEKSKSTNKMLMTVRKNEHGQDCIIITHLIYNKKAEQIGSLVLFVNIKSFQEILDDAKTYGVNLAHLIDTTGNTILSSVSVSNIKNFDRHNITKIKELINNSDEYSTQYFSNSFDQNVYDLYLPVKFHYINDLWIMRLIYPLDSVHKEIRYNILLIGFVALVCSVIGISVATVTAKNISKPVSRISHILENIAENNFDIDIPNFNSSNEIGQMYRAAIILKQHAKELLIAKQIAEAASASKSNFLANMSHELRTPMHAILSYTKLGLDRIDDKQSKIFKYLTNVYISGERLLKLLNDLLDMSKLEAGKIEFNFIQADINKCFESAIMELKALIGSKKLKIEFNPLCPNVLIEFDSEKITQVVINILSNAIKFSPQEGKIKISIKLRSNDIIISIEDEGIGIPEGEVKQIFDKFAQSSITNTGSGGTGLGLSIAKSIVKAHNGKIWAKSDITKGAIFRILIPVNQEIKKLNTYE